MPDITARSAVRSPDAAYRTRHAASDWRPGRGRSCALRGASDSRSARGDASNPGIHGVSASHRPSADDPGVAAAIAALDQRSIVVPDLPVQRRRRSCRGRAGTPPDRSSSSPRAGTGPKHWRRRSPSTSRHGRSLLWPAPEALPYEQLPFDLETATERAALLDLAVRAGARRTGPGPGYPGPRADADRHAAGCASRLDPGGPSGRPADPRTNCCSWVTEHGYEADAARSRARPNRPPRQHPRPLSARRPMSRFASIFSATRSTPSAHSIRTPSAPTTGCARFASCHLPNCHWHVCADAADELRDVESGWAASGGPRRVGPDRSRCWSRGRRRPRWTSSRPTSSIGRRRSSDYLAPESLVIVDEPSAVELVASQLERQASELRDAFVANGELPAGLRSPIAPWSHVRKALRALVVPCRLALRPTVSLQRFIP